MLSGRHLRGRSSGPATVRYFKYLFLSPKLYVQERHRWCSYRQDGSWYEAGRGKIPEARHSHLQEISAAEAERFVPVGSRQIRHPPGLNPKTWRSTKTPSAPLMAVEIRPRGWRYFLLHATIPAAMVILAAWRFRADADRFRMFWDLFIGTSGVAGGYLAARRALRERGIRVTVGTVSGPDGGLVKGRGMPQQMFPIADLDRPRSHRRRWIDRRLGRQYLWSVNDKRILLQRWAYADEDLHRLLGLLGMDWRNAKS